jgi:hypothetical protein
MIERMCLSDFLGDFVAYRNLAPSDRRVRGLSAIHAELGLPAGRIPRKTEPEYAGRRPSAATGAVRARRGSPTERVLGIGDTRLNDGTAARNLAQHLAMRAFIGEDKPGEAVRLEAQDEFVFANRWTALGDFLRQVQEQGFVLDAATAVVLDLDKTAIGARGRNDKPIDQARVDAALDIARATLGSSFRLDTFRPIYDELHKPGLPLYHDR